MPIQSDASRVATVADAASVVTVTERENATDFQIIKSHVLSNDEL